MLSIASRLVNFLTISQKPKVAARFGSVEKEYEVLKVLGTGRYGVVRSAFKRDDVLRTTPLAIKTVKKRATRENPYISAQLKNEIAVLDNVKDFKGVQCLIDSFEDEGNVHIVTRLYDGGELFDRIVERGSFSDVDARVAMRQILETIAFMHAMGVVHRDIKPENLLYENKKPDANLVLIDFGMARTFKPGDKFDLECGSPSYVAPEVLNRSYSEKCDLWSCGVLMHILLTGRSPFGTGTEEEILAAVSTAQDMTFAGPEWKSVSQDAKDLVFSLLRVDPTARPSATECLKFEFVKLDGLDSIKSKRDLDFDVPLHELRALENLREFNLQRKLKRAALKVIAGLNSMKQNGLVVTRPEMLNTIDIDEKYLREAFKSFDVSGDGLIDKAELRILLAVSEGQVDEKMLDDVMRDADIDGSGTISFEEFVWVVKQKGGERQQSSSSSSSMP